MPITNGDVTHLAIKNVYATTGMIVFGGNPAWHDIASPAIPCREYPSSTRFKKTGSAREGILRLQRSRFLDIAAEFLLLTLATRGLDSNCAALHPANFVNDITCPTGDRM